MNQNKSMHMKRVITILAMAAALSSLGILAQTANNSLPTEDPLAQDQNVGQTPTSGGFGGQVPRFKAERRQGGSSSALVFGGDQGYTYRAQNRFSSSAEKPLIIRSADMSPKDETNLQEDLAVMAHIL